MKKSIFLTVLSIILMLPSEDKAQLNMATAVDNSKNNSSYGCEKVCFSSLIDNLRKEGIAYNFTFSASQVYLQVMGNPNNGALNGTIGKYNSCRNSGCPGAFELILI